MALPQTSLATRRRASWGGSPLIRLCTWTCLAPSFCRLFLRLLILHCFSAGRSRFLTIHTTSGRADLARRLSRARGPPPTWPSRFLAGSSFALGFCLRGRTTSCYSLTLTTIMSCSYFLTSFQFPPWTAPKYFRQFCPAHCLPRTTDGESEWRATRLWVWAPCSSSFFSWAVHSGV